MKKADCFTGKRGFTSRKELFLFGLVILALLAIIFFFPREKTGDIIATVYYRSEEYTKINLSQAKDGTILKIPGDLPVKLKVKNHHIRFVDAQCPDKICEQYGYIGSPGEQAVCLPAKVGIIIGSDASDVDMMAK
ncbi:MAG: NusG domain II-containing protein [Peptococcaceae bacterium]|jgi:hypothetical protein|nr:NusG domain II-containing protein [Peptococcaceae bacterium]